jgi:hypothetical protein
MHPVARIADNAPPFTLSAFELSAFESAGVGEIAQPIKRQQDTETIVLPPDSKTYSGVNR